MEKLLSICMIVKNEDDVLERCLKSVNDLADELIIVDTGSTDSTKKIAALYTDHVYDFKWVNDFSVARNESIRHATSQWVLVLDADEYINPDDIARIRLFLQEEAITPSSIYTISVVSYVGQSIHSTKLTEASIPRLFPNFQGIQYERPIHEQLINTSGETLRVTASPITVFHTGYILDVIDKKRKQQRNEKIFSELKKKTGFTPYDHFCVGNEFSVKGDLKKALYSYERAFSKTTSQHPWRFDCASKIWNIFLKLDRLSDAWELNEKFFKAYDNFPEYHCFQGIIYEQMGMYGKSKSAFEKSIQKAEQLSAKSKFWLINPLYGSSIPLNRLAHLASIEQDLNSFVYYQTKILQSNPNEYNALSQLLDVLANHESVQSVQQYIDKLYPELKQRDLHMLVSILTNIGQTELSKIYYSELNDPSLLRMEIQLKYAILHDQQQVFRALLKSIDLPIDQSSTLRCVAAGNILWGVCEKSLEIFQTAANELSIPAALYEKLIHDKEILDEWSDEQSLAIFEFASELFLLKKYELFDRVVQRAEHSALLNLLANFFFKKNQIDLSVNYYQIVLERNELTASGCENLAFLHFNNNLIDDGLVFLERAIELGPDSKQLLGYYISHSNNETKKLHYMNLLYDYFPLLRKLSIIK
ncbi:hypothetical protein B1748_18560 [Paenibacillus sp. MY03]|uniref:tetratricopeptide repeat-containing glycosyltransferase family 2 protein n=1 Tax=Paenibacillus sp. MY03 TaxID=302980 RepID=UPI000B3C4B1C|nr:glycosyltransferase family 2 protein [Paenibacillus sp. MY03]OUS75141.1 hypothetical protein B1748_18560 [Paenibacillus sp. MY03]